jgi:hypothetical protein
MNCGEFWREQASVFIASEARFSKNRPDVLRWKIAGYLPEEE